MKQDHTAKAMGVVIVLALVAFWFIAKAFFMWHDLRNAPKQAVTEIVRSYSVLILCCLLPVHECLRSQRLQPDALPVAMGLAWREIMSTPLYNVRQGS